MKSRDDIVTIEIDKEVFKKLEEIAMPFVDINPNLVIRRLLGLPPKPKDENHRRGESKYKTIVEKKSEISDLADKTPLSNFAIEELRSASPYTNPAFLTFLMDKFLNAHGNYSTADIIPFMEKMNLTTLSGGYRNPWMKSPYGGQRNGRNSCIRTIEHFRQTRKFGCWGGRDIKTDCDAKNYCIYHPDNPDQIKNKCDLRKGAIWKRSNPDSPIEYGKHYLKFVKKELLKNEVVPLKLILRIFYPNENYGQNLIDKFKSEFHMDEAEMQLFNN